MTEPTYQLPFWMDGSRATAVARAAKRWWELAEGYIRLPLTTFDPLNCELALVDLLAYQRGIDRFAAESESFYRLRVHHALRNARVAGTPAGMRQIFANLDLPEPYFTERMPNRDWDMVRVRFAGRGYARLHAEIDFVLRFYWRTCRRFEIVQDVSAENHYGVALYGHGRAYNRMAGAAARVPFRPASNVAGVALYGNNRALQHTKHRSQPVPFRHAMHRMQPVPFRHAMHRMQPVSPRQMQQAVGVVVFGHGMGTSVAEGAMLSVPVRNNQNSVCAGSWASIRSINVRSFAT